jgi:Rrp44-like cold shock domain
MNRAVQGDVVVVEVFDEKEWKAPADEVVDQDCTYSVIFRFESFVFMFSFLSNSQKRRCGFG